MDKKTYQIDAFLFEMLMESVETSLTIYKKHDNSFSQGAYMAYDEISRRLEDLMVHSGLQDEYNNLYDKIYRYINRPKNNT